MKYYRLLKDLPDLKAGAIFEEGENGAPYSPTKMNKNHYLCWDETIENNHDWFEQVWKCEKCGEFYTLNPNVGKCPKCMEKELEKECKPVKIQLLDDLPPMTFSSDTLNQNRMKINEIINIVNELNSYKWKDKE